MKNDKLFGLGPGITQVYWENDETLGVVGYETHKVTTSSGARGGRKSKSSPPLHIHLKQAELFKVQSGTMGYVLNGKEYSLTKDDAEITIPPHAPHTFWPIEGDEDLTIRIRLLPDYPGGLDERFLRNLYGYFNDCFQNKIEPSIIQLMLFFYSADTLVAIPYLPVWIIHYIHWFMGVIVGTYILGYKDSYSEYYDENAGSNW